MHEGTPAILTTIVVAMSVGVLLIALARRLGVPAIVLLLGGGVAMGPVGLGFVEPSSLGDGLEVMVALLVGIVLFEGGLTLQLDGYRSAPKVITRLLSVGVVVTWVTSAVAIWLITGRAFTFCLIAASLIIVTGPTVVGPLLRRIRVNERLHHILQWEGVLIDPIGVFIAILCFEALALQRGGMALLDFAQRIGVGIGLGVLGGFVCYFALHKRLIPEGMAGVGTLGLSVLLFGGTELLAPEAGLLSMTIAGFIVGWRRPASLPAVRKFKEELTELAIGMLFLLLTARLELAQFVKFGWSGVAIVAAIIFVVRPVAVIASTWGTTLTLRERAFLSWIAPRGIVAASMASLFAIELERIGVADSRFVESFTYAVILGTIVLQGGTAGLVARLLDVTRVRPAGWLLIGAHHWARTIARYLMARGAGPVLLVDVNRRHVQNAEREGLSVVKDDAFDVESIQRREELAAVGNMLALTPNEELNVMLARRWRDVFGEKNCYRWGTAAGMPGADRGAGTKVWTGLPSPAVVASELDHGEARALASPEARDAERQPAYRLFSETKEGVTIDVKGVEQTPTRDGEALFLAREASLLLRCLQSDLTYDTTASSKEELLREAFARASDTLGVTLPDEVLSQLLEREASMPAVLTGGVAVPHAFASELDRQVCVVVRHASGLKWFAPTEEPVRLVFLILSPAGAHARHLAVLADLARLMTSEDLQKRLFETEGARLLDEIRAAHVP